MSESEIEVYGDMAERRRHLIAQIARQRGELAQAYRNLEAPLHYAEYGLRGFGFLRKNPWVLTVIPAAMSITSTVVGLVRNKPAKVAPRQRQSLRHDLEKESKGWKKHAVTWGKRGWKVFKLYRRFRHYLIP
jgi:hypothetical protein